ncbi:MAG: hypothetical protein AAFX06_06105 [Planctomycetota bacterium]
MSGTASIGAVNNQLGITGHQNGVDLETLFMSLGAERANTLDGVIQGHAADMKKRNDEINELNSALQTLRAHQNNVEGNAGGSTTSTLYANASEVKAAYETLQKHGVQRPSSLSIHNVNDSTFAIQAPNGQAYKDGMSAYIENVKTAIDSKSSSSQLDMIKMQGLINKRNQTVEMLTNLVQKFAKTKDSIIGNMR